MPSLDWRFYYRVAAHLPPLFWIARIRAPVIEVHCGTSVRRASDAFLEGTWSGGPDLHDAAAASTVYATGIVLTLGGPLVVTPSQPQEGVYTVRLTDETLVANSLAGLLARASLSLDSQADYPAVFRALADMKWLHEVGQPPRLAGCRLQIPTTSETVEGLFYENFRIQPDGNLDLDPKPREPTFASFDDYRDRLTRAVSQLFDNGRPYTPVIALSSGYDSTAVAAVAAPMGARRAVGFRTARQLRDGGATDDSGAATAERLGLAFQSFERMAYMERDDLPEAEFLATGASAEDVVLTAFEPALRRVLLLTGHWGGRMWDESAGPHVRHLPPPDLSGCSLTDFRLRTDFIHMPLPFFGNLQQPTLNTFAGDADMRPYRLGGVYDRPIARRLAEDAGIPRGTFARRKIAVSTLLHRDGRTGFAPATLRAIEQFAAAEGDSLEFQLPFRTRRRHRALVKVATRLDVERLVHGLERRRRAAVHFDRRTGTLLFRWAVSVVGRRYLADVDSTATRSLS